MNTLNRIKFANIICIVLLFICFIPDNAMAQRFGHGGGGGGGRGGGGGAPRGGGGGFSRGGGDSRPMQVGPRTINGGGRNIGNHDFSGFRPGPRGVEGIHHSENVFHHGYVGGHAYFYHPYHPYAWGPYWHPFGYFAASLTANAILFSLANQQYYYDNGVYYEPSNGGYAVVAPPVGAVVTYLPSGAVTVQGADGNSYYYYGGVFYISQGGSFRVVPAAVGAIVMDIPEGATQQNINGESYLLYNNAYYLPISQDGQDAYQVVQVN